MTVDFKIEENDFLTHQLYIASRSQKIKKKRLRSKLIVPLIYVGFGLMCLYEGNYFVMSIFIIFGFLWFLFYPIWERKHYVNHYKGFIRENYKERLGRTSILKFANDFIDVKEDGSESKIATREIEEIVEIPSLILIRFKIGHSFVIPKDKITDLNVFREKLKELAVYLNISYVLEENWKW